MELNALFTLGLSLVIVYVVKWAVEKVNIPAVTGYVIMGVLIGSSLLKLYDKNIIASFSIVSDLALALISFAIGIELNRETLLKLGKPIIVIAVFEAFFAFAIVALVLYLIDPAKLYRALILGAVASATAPAATVYVIQQYRAKGPLTTTILAVVGIDDAIALIIYVFAALFAEILLKASRPSIPQILVLTLGKIVASFLLGAIAGVGYAALFKKVRFPDDLSVGVGAATLLVMGTAEMFGLSELLAVMALGSVVVNADPQLANRSNKAVESFSPILLPLFFMLAGAQLNVFLIVKVGILGLVFTAARFAGKLSGATFGAAISGAPKVVTKFIGFSLLPQVGVAVALSLAVLKTFGRGAYGGVGVELADTVINVLLFTTIITEVAGPMLTKYSIIKANEKDMRE